MNATAVRSTFHTFHELLLKKKVNLICLYPLLYKLDRSMALGSTQPLT